MKRLAVVNGAIVTTSREGRFKDRRQINLQIGIRSRQWNRHDGQRLIEQPVVNLTIGTPLPTRHYPIVVARRERALHRESLPREQQIKLDQVNFLPQDRV